MIWLKGLKKVKEELRNEKWPQSAQEGLYTGIILMSHALEEIKKDIKKSMPHASNKRIQLEFRRMLIRFNKIDARWTERYKWDYEKIKTR